MNTKHSILRAAVVAALGLPIIFPQLSAATTVAIEVGKPIKFSTEMVNETTAAEEFKFSTGMALGIDITAAATSVVKDTAPMEIRVTLTDGATFSTLPTAADFGCDYAGGTIIPSVNLVAAGERTATFKLANGTIATTSPKCTLSAGTIKLGNGQQDYTMVVSGYLNDEQEPKSISTAGAFVTFGQACVMMVESNSVTIDVGSSSLSKKFISNLDSSKKIIQTAFLGNFSYQAKSDVTAHYINASNVPKEVGKVCGAILDKITISLSGTPLVSGMTAWVQTKASPNCDTTDGMSAQVVGSSVTFKEVDYTDAAATTTALSVCYMVDGNTRVEKGKITYDLSKVDKANSIANISVAGDPLLTNFYKNGTSVKVLNIPEPSDAKDKINVRIYNFGDTTASIYGTLYADTAGSGTASVVKVDGSTAVKIADVPARGVAIVQSTAVGTLYKLPTMPNSTAVWKGRAWMQIEGDSQNIRVQAMMRTGGASAALFNMSDRVMEDGGAFCRSGTTCK